MISRFIFFLIYLSSISIVFAGDYNLSILLAGGYDDQLNSESHLKLKSVKDTDRNSLTDSYDGEDESFSDFDNDAESHSDLNDFNCDSFVILENDTSKSTDSKTSESSVLADMRKKFIKKPSIKAFVLRSEFDQLVEEFVDPMRDGVDTLHYHELTEPKFLFEHGDTLLHHAIRTKKYDIAKNLITHIATVWKNSMPSKLDVPNNNGETALHLAIKAPDLNFTIIEKLVNCGANILALDKNDHSPLDVLDQNHKDPMHPHYKTVQQLVDPELRKVYKRNESIKELKTALQGSREQRKRLIEEKKKIKLNYENMKLEYEAIQDECSKLREQLSHLSHSSSGSDSAESSDSSTYTSSMGTSAREDRLHECINVQEIKIDELERHVHLLEKYKRHYTKYKKLNEHNKTTIENAHARLNAMSSKINLHQKLGFTASGVILTIVFNYLYNEYHHKQSPDIDN